MPNSPTMELTSLDEVKRHPALSSVANLTTADVDIDEYLQQLILTVSALFERETGRWFQKATYTELFDLDFGRKTVTVRAYPIASISSIRNSASGDFSGAAMSTSSYALREEGRTGQISMRWMGLVGGVGALRVVYVGGLGHRAEALPADLRMAATEQVAFLWKRAKNIDQKGETHTDGSATYFADVPLLPLVRQVLDGYRRMAR